MKHFMLRSLMLFSLLCSTLGVNSVWAQLTHGKVYNFANVGQTGKSLVIESDTKLIVATTDVADTKQQWYVEEVSTGVFALRNMHNGKYLKSPNATGNANWTTVLEIEDNCKLVCTTMGSNYTFRANNTSDDNHYLHYSSADYVNKVVCWSRTPETSQWTLTEVAYDADILGEILEEFDLKVPSKIAQIQTNLRAIFEDDACTKVKSTFTSEAEIEASSAYKALPASLRNMVMKVYNQTWTENNYDSKNKSAWDNDYAKKYRVQWYEPYTEPECAAKALRINAHTNLNNPTGIFANSGDVLFVMVEGEIQEGAYLYLSSYTGHGKLGGYSDGTELHTGLNVIPVTADGTNYCINYVVQTFDTSKGTGKNAIIQGRELSNYHDLQIHIEGGYINGYWNKMGDNADHNGDFNYPADTDADWDYIKERATQTDVTVLGEYVTLQFPLTDEGTVDDKGMGTFFNSYNDKTTSLEASIQEWDNVMIWERLLMGVLGEKVIEKEDKKSPYSTETKVTAYTGDDTDEFGCDYSEYYRIHGLSFGTEGGYMYGGWDHCGYNFNTMESIMLSIVDEAGPHWGPAHEIGHQHQGPLNMRGLTEVTNNLFSNVVLWYFGKSTSRYNGTDGSLSNVLQQFNAEGTDFFSNNIWAQTIMYYKLFLYYHVLGNNPKFYPRLFEMLRQDPMTIEYNQDGGKCLLHFYKLCCEAAQEDLTEFFRAHGFFEVMENRFVGDYSNAIYNMTQAQIDAAIEEVKSNDEWKENIAVLFVTDATGETIQSHKGDNLELYGEVCAELGSYANFNNNTASAYTATVSGTTVTMTGEGGVGFAILNKKGELIGFSDKTEFELSLDAVEAILNGEANFVVVNGDASTTPATIEGNADERNKSLLGEMMESVKEFTNYEDATGKKIGYYKSSSLESMKAALEKAQEVYDKEEKTSYTAVFNVLKQEYNAFLAADYNEVPMTAGTFILKNCSNKQHLCVNNENSLSLTSTAESDLDNTAKWVFEKAGAGKYYIKNLSTGKYIDALTKDQVGTVTGVSAAAIYDVVPKDNPGEFAIVYGDKVSFNASYKGIIGWDYNTDRNSWWYITAVETDAIDAQAIQLKELLDKTQALYDQMAVTPIPQVIPLTESSYFSNALQIGGAYPSDNFESYSVLCDVDPFTHFHSAYSGTNPGTHHYIRVDLGEEYKSDLFAFTYTNRTNTNKQNPTAITVEGSNEVDGTYEHIANLTTLDGLPTTEASSFESELLGTQGTVYRYLRFTVTETNSNSKFGDYPYFSITELGVLKGSFAITANSKYASDTITNAYMLEVFNALRQAKHNYRNATTAGEYTDAYNTLYTYYETLLKAYNKVKGADLTAKKAELRELIDNTTDLIGQCGSVKYTEETTPQLNITAAPYLLTDNNGAGQGTLDKLYDGLQGENNSYTSSWSGTTTEASYLQVDLGTGNELEELIFTFTNRTEGNAPTPTEIVVSASEDGNTFTPLDTYTSEEANWPPAANGQNIAATKWTSPVIKATSACRYWRFTVTKSQRSIGDEANANGVYHFGISEFGIVIPASCKVTVNEGMGEVTEEILLATYDENEEAKSTHTYATTEAQLDKAIADLQAQYDALEEAKGNVDKSGLVSLIKTATTKLDECGTVTPNGDVLDVTLNEQAGSVNKNMLRDLYRAIEKAQGVIDNTNATQEEVNAEITELTAQIEVVQTAKNSTAKADLKTAIDAAQTAINECASSITKDGDAYTVVWNFETAGDVDKATLIAAYEALAQANAVYNGETSTVSEYQAAKEALGTPITTLNAYKTGDRKSQLKSKVDLLTELIANCEETHGDLTDDMYDDIVQCHETASAYLTQEFETHGELVNTIDGAISDIDTNYPTWSAAQQSTAKTDLLAMIKQLEGLIEQCRDNGTNIVTTDVPCALQTTDGSDFYISTNATATEGDIANLVDGKMNTSFQTKNSVGAGHYLLVDAGEGNALKKFKFSYRTNKSPFPYTIVVYGSNDKEATFTELATFTDLPTNADQLWTSSEIVSQTAYRYLRFNVTKSGVVLKIDDNKEIITDEGEQLSNKYNASLYAETPQGEYCFAMSEFDLINRVDVEGVTEDQITPAEAAINEANALAETSANATALSEKKSELDALYNDLNAAYLAASQRIQVTLTTTDAKRDELLSGIEFGQTIGTFSAPYATVIPEGVTAYYAEQEYEGGTVSLTPIEKGMALPAEQGVILIGEVGVNSVMFIPATDETPADLSANTFSNSAASSVVMGSNDYILANGGQGIGFYQATEGTTLKQGKAFFRLPAGAGAVSLVLKFGDNTTDIDAVTTGTPSDDELIYDIYGRRVTEVKKGNIYIKNGKKFFVK